MTFDIERIVVIALFNVLSVIWLVSRFNRTRNEPISERLAKQSLKKHSFSDGWYLWS